MKEKKTTQLCIVTVIGEDHVGIVGRLASVMARANINILDITQKVFEETFVMTMAVDVALATIGMDKIKSRLDRIGKEMALKITIQDDNIFKAMHRV